MTICVHLFTTQLVTQMSLCNSYKMANNQMSNVRRNNHIVFSDLSPPPPAIERAQNVSLGGQGPIERIKNMFGKVELSVSSYDTAWVAMVPSRNYPNKPSFPDCLDWVLENQNPDGSWGLLNPSHPLLVKDSLSSTLACVLALQKWNVGKQLVNRGLDYIGSNILAADDKSQYSPIGFEIVFPGMISFAKELGLNLPLNPSSLQAMLRQRDLEIKRGLERKRHHLDYVAEGLMDGSYRWADQLMKFQRRNGSLFNSPSTTAAALIHLHNDKCFDYLLSVLELCGNAVPTIYPLDTNIRLCMVDRVERLGIDRYFRHEIESVLDETYRCWLQKDEDIVLDVNCCAMAFRQLRMNGYEVSSDVLAEYVEQEQVFNSASPQFIDTNTVLDLYKASLVTIFEKEPTLEKLRTWTSSFLKQQLLNHAIHDQRLHNEVEYALKHPYSSLERVVSRRSIEQYNVDNFRILKTSYRCSNIDNRDFQKISVKDYNILQAIHHEEIEQIERWVKETRLDHIKCARQKQITLYFLIASVIFSPEFSDARISHTKNGFLVTVVDDFFEVGGSTEEFLNLIELTEKWDDHTAIDFCSEQVEILFYAIYGTINELAAKAFAQQGRCIKHHLIETWLDFLKSEMREAEWVRNKKMPSMDEYVKNGLFTIGIAPCLLSNFLLGSKLSEEVVRSAEYTNLFEHTSTITRLSNDLQTAKRESAQHGTPNSMLLYATHGDGEISEEEAMRKVKEMIEMKRRELQRMVVQTKGSLVPKACKDLFWKTSKQAHYLYMSRDEYTSSSSHMIDDINAVLYNPISAIP